MSKLNVDQKTIKDLLTAKHADFLIPDYQRPYTWSVDECGTLWDDLFDFSFPERDSGRFDSISDEYYLGPIVTFRNPKGQLEIIDGQQRLTTLLLLLRAFYDRFTHQQGEYSKDTRNLIATCVWKTNELNKPDRDRLKIDSEVASDAAKEEFLTILRTGAVEKQWKSAYATNFRFFQNKISDLVNRYPSYVVLFALRILQNVILLPIEAESQATALRIFSTLNDRGLPLSDADIFKSHFYKFFSANNKKDSFIQDWKQLEELSQKVFTTQRRNSTPMDELFTRYMYYERAKRNIRDTSTKALRDFYSENSYALLKNEQTFENLKALADFWDKIARQDDSFSDAIRKRLFVLSYAPNGMWSYLVSVYFFARRDKHNTLEETAFLAFLNRITAFIFAYAVDRPGVNALRSPVYPEMINLVNGKDATFADYRFTRSGIRGLLEMHEFTNMRPITKSLLVWWMFHNPKQRLIQASTALEIEHIYSRRRAKDTPLAKKDSLESIGNKVILEERINIRASDYRFEDKKKYYCGYTDDNGKTKERTVNEELLEIAATHSDFTESCIENRKTKIIDSFIAFLSENQLIEEDGV